MCVDQVSLNRFSDYKRLRKTPPNSPNPDSTMETQEPEVGSASFDPPQITNQTQSTTSVQQQATPTFSPFEWETESMDVEVHGKPKFPDFGHSKSS